MLQNIITIFHTGNVNRWFMTCVNQPQFKSIIGEFTLCEKMAVFDNKKYQELHPKTQKAKDNKPKQEKKPKEEKPKATAQGGFWVFCRNFGHFPEVSQSRTVTTRGRG